MKFTYETGIATLGQFISLSFLGIANALDSIITACHTGQSCVENLFTSTMFFILTVAWFGCIWILGYMAQERRSKRLAQLLICTEGLIALIALFNAKHHTDILGLFTSLLDLLLALWVITLAFRLMRANGRRITHRQRIRKRQV